MLKATILFLLTLSACNHKSSDPEIGIPADIPFNEKALPPMSDADFEQAKTVAKTLGDATSTRGQLLIKRDQSNSDQERRTRRFNRLRPEVQQLVQGLRQNCTANPVKDGRGVEGKPKQGEVYHATESNSLSGALCSVDAAEKVDSTISVLRFTDQPLSFAMVVAATGSGSGQYRDPAQARVVGASYYGLTFTMRGRFEREGQVGHSYMRMDGRGDIATLDFGSVHIDAVTEELEHGGNQKKLTTYRMTHNGQAVVFTQYREQSEKSSAPPRYFIGNRELSQTDAEALGEFPFDFE